MWGMESYDKKLTRRLRTRAGFPIALQQVPIRYVDEIFALTDRQQELLIEALAMENPSGKLSRSSKNWAMRRLSNC